MQIFEFSILSRANARAIHLVCLRLEAKIKKKNLKFLALKKIWPNTPVHGDMAQFLFVKP